MTHKKYIKPQTKVRTLRFTLLHEISGGGQSWGAKQNSFSSDIEFNESVDEINKMFE